MWERHSGSLMKTGYLTLNFIVHSEGLTPSILGHTEEVEKGTQ